MLTLSDIFAILGLCAAIALLLSSVRDRAPEVMVTCVIMVAMFGLAFITGDGSVVRPFDAIRLAWGN